MEEALSIRLLVVTPDDVIVDVHTVSVRFQEPDGWRGILPHHAPYVTQLVNSVLMYRLADDADPHYLALYGGTLEVKKDMIVVLTSAAEHGERLEDLSIALLKREAEADALAMEAQIEFTQMRTALVRALSGLPPPSEVIR